MCILWWLNHYLFEERVTRTPSNWKSSKEEKKQQ